MADSTLLDLLEAEAKEQIASIREYRTYAGANPEYRQRAKLALGVLGATVRLRATLANEHTNRLVELRILSESPKQIGDGRS